MNKLLFSLMSSFIGITLTGNVFAYEIGDKMPDFKNLYFFVGENEWYSQGKRGVREGYGAGEDNSIDFVLIYEKCNGEAVEIPFGFYDRKTKTVFFDKNYDNVIDEKLEAGGYNDPGDHAPGCQK